MMFENAELRQLLDTSSSVESTPVVVSETNMNKLDNVYALGCYKNTATDALPTQWNETSPSILWAKFFSTDALYESIEPESYKFEYNEQKKIDRYYSLEDCIKPNRPRSGINKILYRRGKMVDDLWSADRPRYYYASPDDSFKYWTSYRNYGNGEETGISDAAGMIENAAPFVIYKEPVPANRIVVKMQTNIGSQAYNSTGSDPLVDESNSSIPLVWDIQYLNSDNEWQTAYSFPTDEIGAAVGPDGHMEISYGVLAPPEFLNNMVFGGFIGSTNYLPDNPFVGEAYVVGASEYSSGALNIWSGDSWLVYQTRFGFKRHSPGDSTTNLVKQPVSPPSTIIDGKRYFYEFVMLRGLRTIVKKMVNPSQSFELIEFSPRLSVDLTSWTESYDLEKSASFDDEAFPVGGLVAGTGSISLFNGDGAFVNANTLSNGGSVFAGNMQPGTKFMFSELYNVNGEAVSVPIKTLYAESWPEATSPTQPVTLQLRDAYFLLEQERSPDVLRRNMSLTGAVAWLLDYAGFSNYRLLGFDNADPIIPFFFTNKDNNIAQTLEELSKSTQTMMYFDEYNNFVVASKEYIYGSGDPVFSFTGSDVFENGSVKALTNIESLSEKAQQVFNSGSITYTERYIQRSPKTLSQAGTVDRFRQYIYKPVLLWEVSADENTKTTNAAAEQQQGYALSAMALSSELSSDPPTVSNGTVINNAIDVGENAIWAARYDGYLYANGEIIRYDAIEFSIPGQGSGTVWISSNEEYQFYFGRTPFGGSIYPTGRLRIYSKPYYDNGLPVDGNVMEHGRGMFDTEIVAHSAGLSDYWRSNENTMSIETDSSYIFNGYQYDANRYKGFVPDLGLEIGGINDPGYTIGSTIKNMWSEWYRDETGSGDIDPGAVQASALCLNGPQNSLPKKRDVMTISSKELGGAEFVGSRMRLIGREENGLDGTKQTVVSPFSFDFSIQKGSQANLSGGSAGICTFFDRQHKTGYFFELVSFSAETKDMIVEPGEEYENVITEIKRAPGVDSNKAYVRSQVAYGKIQPGYTIRSEGVPDGTTVVSLDGDKIITMSNQAGLVEEYQSASFDKYAELQARAVHNVLFYKLVPGDDEGTRIVPVKLWGALAEVLVDQGIFVGQSRAATDTPPTVYDLGIEYAESEGLPTFTLYINGTVVAVVQDNDVPGNRGDARQIIANGTHCGMFVRGSTSAMFENIMSIKKNSISTDKTIGDSIWGDALGTPNTKKMLNYQISPFLRTAMAGTKSNNYGEYSIDYDEFGTIMRECAYFNVRYDQAYPSFYSKLAPTINRAPAFITTNYIGGPYSAQFMLFNITDKPINLDETTGNYLRILGVTFTQSASKPYTVEDFLEKRNNSAALNTIRASRRTYGEKAFSFDHMYVQTKESADALMEWMLDKIVRPRVRLSMNIFPVPMVQLGDTVSAEYTDSTGTYIDSTKELFVNKITYGRNESGPTMTIGLVEK